MQGRAKLDRISRDVHPRPRKKIGTATDATKHSAHIRAAEPNTKANDADAQASDTIPRPAPLVLLQSAPPDPGFHVKDEFIFKAHRKVWRPTHRDK